MKNKVLASAMVVTMAVSSLNVANVFASDVTYASGVTSVHEVVKGDSLWKISKKYGVSIIDILKENSIITNKNLIFPGQKFNIVNATKAPAVVAPVVKAEPAKPADAPAKAEVKPAVDAVTSATVKEGTDTAIVTTGLSEKGKWIFSITGDVKLADPLYISGTFHDKDDATKAVRRKFALNAQDEKYQVTKNYTLTVPKVVVNSPNTLIQNGTINGDVVVSNDGFELNATNLNGNLVFANEQFKASAKIDTAKISGKVTVAPAVDAVTSASVKESSKPADVVTGLSEKGGWIFATLSDVTLTEPLYVSGAFHSKDDPTAVIARKLALYSQDDNKNVTNQFKLTVPKIVVNTPAFKIQNGTVKGDIYVNNNKFELKNTTVDGKVVFANQEYKASALLDAANILGAVTVAPAVDAITSASVKESSKPADITKGLSDKGAWIFAVLSDVTMKDELVVSGTFHDKDDATAKVYRKLALYAQDEKHNVTQQFKLTVPKIVVNSPSFRIQNGSVKGDIYVNAEKFEIVNTEIDGNIVFATQALRDSALLGSANVLGTITVK